MDARETLDPAALLRDIEALREQRRTIGKVFRAVARSGGLQAVLDEVVASAERLCAASTGTLYVLRGELLHAVSRSGNLETWEYDKTHPHGIDRTTVVGRAALARAPAHIPDVLADPEYTYTGPRSGYRALLGVPILFENDLMGGMTLTRHVPKPFSEDEIELVTTFADQAAIAIANARLIEAVEGQLEQQRAISDVLRAVARSEQLESVFERLVDAAKRLCHAEFGVLFLADGDVLRFASGHKGEPGLERHDRDHPHARDRRTAIGRAALVREVVHIPDVQADPEYDWEGQEVAEYRTILAAPILIEDELIGAMDVARRSCDPFAREEIELLRTFADQAAIAIANARLIDAVERQRTELSRFVSPQVAELVSSEEGEKMLAGHRAYISALFCDLRGFTAFAETASPEELLHVLAEYHLAVGHLVPEHEGTLEHFAGDGLLVFFNDPLPVEEHELKAIRFALAAQERFAELAEVWRKQGIELALGIGIASGYATLGRIGFEGRYDYGALGPVTNLASRLSSAATPGQTLIGQRVYAAVEDAVEAQELPGLDLKGFGRPVAAYNVLGLA